jgi:P27 family predicted phage terminase small subunit
MPRVTKPTALKKLEGDIHKERWPKNEPQPKGGTTAPKFLNRHARSEWKRIYPELERLGLLTKIDRTHLAAYCQAYGKWVEVENQINELSDIEIKKSGNAAMAYLHKTIAGNIIINPLMSVSNRCVEQMHIFAIEFGMTPVSRSRINLVQKEKEEDPMERLLSNLPPGVEPERER